jgi:hypothetical protein
VTRWLAFGFVMFLVACGGGGGGSYVGVPVPTPSVTTTGSAGPSPTPTPYNGPSPVSGATAVPLSGNLVAMLPSVAGYGGNLVITGTPGVTSSFGTTVTGTLSLGAFSPLTTFASVPGTVVNQVLVYADFVANNQIVVPAGSTATLTLTFPPNTLTNTPYYYALWNVCSGTSCWVSSTSQGQFPVTTTDFGAGQTITIVTQPNFTFQAQPYGFVIYR